MYYYYHRSSLVGVASAGNEIKFSGKAGGSIRSISFMHTERLIPVDDGDSEDTAQPHPQQVSGEQEAGEDQQQQSREEIQDEVEEESVEVCNVHVQVQ